MDCFEEVLPPLFACVAQLAEHLICNQQVVGSSPIIGSKNRERHKLTKTERKPLQNGYWQNQLEGVPGSA